MPACTFFGHRDCPDTIRPTLRAVLEGLVEHNGVDMFYVGNQGNFDALVRKELRSLERKYPHIRYAVVLAYLPTQSGQGDDPDTMFPEGLENVHPKYAISRRNDWILAHSDYVIAYITRPWGGAARYVRKAGVMDKVVIHIPFA